MSRIFTYLVALMITGLLSLVVSNANAQNYNNEQRFEINTAMKKMTVYPTPANNFVTVAIPVGLREDLDRIQILDISGRMVTEQRILNKSIESVTFNNLSSLANGVYIIAARDREGRMIQSSKMIINK